MGIPSPSSASSRGRCPAAVSIPADGPDNWSSGTLFPLASKKLARAINGASGNRPLVVLANLSGFDGSPDSMRSLQLEYGAEIGRAVVNFRGPIVFCVISRYHGGAFVVFSQALNEGLETIAVEGSRASVIGGAPAAAVVFAGEVNARARRDIRVTELDERCRPRPKGPNAPTFAPVWPMSPPRCGRRSWARSRPSSTTCTASSGLCRWARSESSISAAQLRPGAHRRGRARHAPRTRRGAVGPPNRVAP